MSNPEAQEQFQQYLAEGGEPIFALDIGTRSIIGIVGVPDGDLFRVLDIEMEEHSKRAMIDGQIEDIDQTAKIARLVKERLEEKLGFQLKNVYVAAAGRALRTERASYEMELDPKEQIQEQKVLELEMSAIQQARAALLEDGSDSFYCVGHSIVRYYLDDYPLSTLLNHRGSKAKVEIIATFLPNEVVESLYAAMEKANLVVANVTLEPIAAMNAIIPSELRMLNLALVDVGAGTSDIAISDGGSVSAYTMATVAGDEITEMIVREFLVDFAAAERIKTDLSKNVGNIDYQDILSFNYSISPSEVMERIKPAIENLSTVICDRILEINEKAPAAIFLVGGGSQIPTLCEMVAKKLSIAENKVAVGGNNYMKKMVESDLDLRSPEFATPMGIALTAMLSRSRDIFTVLLNGEKKRVFRNGALTVVDLLMMTGYKQGQIIGRSGQSITFELNQQKKVVRGSLPAPASILVNKKPASISTPLNSGDEIIFEPAVPGKDAAPVMQDVVEQWNQFEVKLNGVRVPAGTVAYLNGTPAGKNSTIHNLDSVETRELLTLSELCQEAKLNLDHYHFLVNGQEQKGGYQLKPEDDIRYFPSAELSTAELSAAELSTAELSTAELSAAELSTAELSAAELGRAKPGAAELSKTEPGIAEWNQSEPVSEEPDSPAPNPEGAEKKLPGEAGGQKQELPETEGGGGRKAEEQAVPREPELAGELIPKIEYNQEQKTASDKKPRQNTEEQSHLELEETVAGLGKILHITINGRETELYPKEDGTPYLFLDMLNFVDIDPSRPQGNIVLNINGHSASYLDVITDGSRIEIHWEKDSERAE